MSYPTYLNEYHHELKVGDKTIKITLGKFAEQAGGAVLAECGDTVVHTTVAMGGESNLGYFPLSVEFVEKLYAAGIIKGSRWVKRDGRPTDGAVLKARVIDRTIRPLFPEELKREVQVINTVFSYDQENPDDMIGMLATGIALSISDVPFDGPMAGLRVGYSKETQKYTLNPTETERENLDLDLIVGGTAGGIAMVEAGANEVDEDVLLGALELANNEIVRLCEEITKIATEYGRTKFALDLDNSEWLAKEAIIKPLLLKKASVRELVEAEARFEQIDLAQTKLEVLEEAQALDDTITAGDVMTVLHDLEKDEVRAMILNEGLRPDGRKTDEIRPIYCEVDVFPRTHGSAMFKRGATQAVTITTLASPSLGQHVEDMDGEEIHHYMHHYNMPPYASGESGRVGSPKRREIGHGALAERALLPVIPSQEEFPYTIHVVSEILSSNGSTSQASVCGSTLSLMAAGVPIKRPVAGIAMGLITEGDKYAVLTDIKDVEDHCGDMDFKVAGTEVGVTCLQMDIKVKGISIEVLTKALAQARAGRLFILGKMLDCLAEPRQELSSFAPKIKQITIPGDRIGELIGPGGKNIKGLIERFGAQIDIEEDEEQGIGLVNISSNDETAIDGALNYISGMMKEVQIGEEYDGVVTRVEGYGAFVNFLPGQEGLVHVSGMSTEYVADAHDLVKVGDKVHVRVSEIQDDGKLKLSMLTPEQEAEARSNRTSNNGGGRSGGNRRPSGSNNSRFNNGSRGGFGPRRR